ncbi:MAG: TetR/AcrR family transcriptional regulator [Polyangiales bacterium]
MSAKTSVSSIRVSEERILRAAARLFRARGFAGTSIRSIAEEAGVLPGSLTYRFRTKEDLIVALAERAVAHALVEVQNAIDVSRDPLERIRLGMRAHLRALLSEDDAIPVLVFDLHRLPDRTRVRLLQARKPYDALWEGLCYGAIGAGQLAAGLNVALVMRFWFGATNSVAFWYRPDGPLTPDQIADAFSTLIALGALSPSARPESLEDAFKALAVSDAGAARNIF